MSIEVICLAFRWICALSVVWRGSTRSDTFALCIVRGGQAREPTLNKPHPRLTAHTVKMELVEHCRWRVERLKKDTKTFKLRKWVGRVTKEVKTDLERFKNDGFLVFTTVYWKWELISTVPQKRVCSPPVKKNIFMGCTTGYSDYKRFYSPFCFQVMLLLVFWHL